MNYLKNIKNLFCMLTSVLIIIFCYDSSFADIISLKDGTVLVGDILQSDDRKVVVENSYGVFRIKRKYIKDIKKIKSEEREQEELARDGQENILEELTKEEEERIKEELAREEERIKHEKKKASAMTGGRISIICSYLSTIGDLKDILPAAYAGFIAFDQGLDPFMGKRHFWMPGVRIAGGYLYYEEDPAKVIGFTTSGGPIWLFPFIRKDWGRIVLSGLPGITFLQIENSDENYEEESNTFSVHSILGYEYPIGRASLFIHGRYMFIYDEDVNLTSIGCELGINYAIW